MKFDSGKVVAAAAMFISLITLIIFIYQTRLMHEQSRLSVQPRLSLNEANIQNDSVFIFRYELWNKGLGPGIIESLAVLYKGERYSADFQEILSAQFPEIAGLTSSRSFTIVSHGSTIQAGEEITLMEIQIPSEHLAEFEQAMKENPQDSIDIEVVYGSMYKNQWKISLKAEDLTPVKIR